MISFPWLFKQQINYIEKASKEHSINWAFWNSKSVKPSSHCFEALQSDRVLRIIWFRSGPRSEGMKIIGRRQGCINQRGWKYPPSPWQIAPWIYIYIYIYIYTHTHIHKVVNFWSGSKPFIKVWNTFWKIPVLVLGQLWWTFLIHFKLYIYNDPLDFYYSFSLYLLR